MKRIYEVRREFGDVYVTAFSEDLVIPWRPLSISDYLEYEQAINRKTIPVSILEDEIFKKCVLDKTLVRRMDRLPAGTITSVAESIYRYSGPPNTAEELNEDIQSARNIIGSGAHPQLAEIIKVITLAFQYTPADIYNMPYSEVLKTLALAEYKLVSLGMMQEPIQFHSEETKEEKERPPPRPRPDAKKLWEQQQQQQSTPPPNKSGKWWETSPILEASKDKRKKIDFEEESKIQNQNILDSHEQNEHPIVREHLIEKKISSERDKMIEDARYIYGDVIAALEQEE